MRLNIPTRSSHFAILISLFLISTGLQAQEKIEWRPVEGISEYLVEIQQDGVIVQETKTGECSIPLVLPAGEYSFRIHGLDPFGNSAVQSGWSKIRIVADSNPFVAELTPTWFLIGDTPVLKARVSGASDGKEGMTSYWLENSVGETIPLKETEISDEDKLMGYSGFIWSGDTMLSPGEWDFVMTNPDGKEARIDKAVSVLESIERNYPNSIQINWNATLPEAGSERYQGVSFAGGSIAFASDFRGKRTRQNPWFKHIGWDVRFSASRFEMVSEETPVTVFSDLFTLTAGLYYATPFDFPLNLVFAMGCGLGYSRYHSPDVERDLLLISSVGNNFYLKDLDSMDPVFRTSGAVRISFLKRFYIDLGCQLSGTMFLNRNTIILEPFAGGGFRW